MASVVSGRGWSGDRIPEQRRMVTASASSYFLVSVTGQVGETVQYCTVYCTVLYCILYCTVLYCRWRRPGSRTPPMTTSTAASSGCAARTGQSPPARRRASRRWKIFVSRDNQLEKLEAAKAA